MRLAQYTFFLFILYLFVTSSVYSNQSSTVVVGISPFSPYSMNESIIPATVDAIQKAIYPRKLEIIKKPTLESFAQSIQNGCCDFMLTSAGFYRRMTFIEVGAKDIATVISDRTPNPNKAEGSVFFALSSRSDLNSISDLQNKNLAINQDTGFSGFQIAMGELSKQGYNPEKFFHQIRSLGVDTGDVVKAIREKKADVGVIRTCSLETLEDTADLKVISPKSVPWLGCVSSTDLYPNWTFSTLPRAVPSVTRDVARALFSMPAVGNGLRWGIATDFTAVDFLFRTLKIGPFFYLRQWTLSRVWDEYKLWIFLGLFAVIGAIAHSFRSAALVKRARVELSKLHQHEMQLEVQSRLAAERMDKMQKLGAVTQMGTLLAHELKQPLGAISSYCFGLLKMHENNALSPDLFRETIQKISNLASKSGRTIDHVRSYAKGQTPTEIFDAIAEIKKIVEQFRKSGRYCHQIEETYVQKFAFIYINRLELELLLQNILQNASEVLSDRYDPKIYLRCSIEKNQLQIRVEDNGKRLSPAEFSRICNFEPHTTKKNGLGLGLCIVRSIVERAKGEILFLNKPDPAQGLIVQLRFPLVNPINMTQS